jgi:hypothetical protein
MRILIVTDVSWDNLPVINRRLCKISPDSIIHTIYTKNISIIERGCSSNGLQLIRHSKSTKQESLCEILNFCEVCVLFHNFVEHNNVCSFVIDKCEKYSIKYFVFSEYTKDFYCSFIDDEKSFRKALKNIHREDTFREVDPDGEIENPVIKIPDISRVLSIIKESYSEIEETKKERAIKLLYDKELSKEDKASKRALRENSRHEFINSIASYRK